MNKTPDWTLVRRLFDEALQVPAAERSAFVAAQPLDEASRAELLSLLAHHDDATDAEPLLTRASSAGASRAGEHFGAWDIVGPLGVGGMGEVFEARRADGSYEGRAAIKVLKRGMDSAAVLQRFTQERQALARLEHPNIARMLDAGLSADGLPYFVMEYVDGQPIDVAVRALPLEYRIELFLQLADAVAYAHRNLLVHRDLKPGNVLVTQEGQVKLLDFGIAKAIDPFDSSDPDATLESVRPFTPNYASPEQVRGEPVGTGTDVYSLGCLLYLMLTGLRPTGRTATTAAEAARAVLTEAPTRPSNLPETETRDPAWTSTRRRLHGDLDNIVLKALEKEPQARYSSVEAFAADIKRYLRGEPVQARHAGALYVAGKFVRRNRLAVAAATTAVLALAVGLGTALWQAHRADQQRSLAEDRLRDIRAITNEVILRFTDAIAEMPKALGVQEKLLTDTLRHLDTLAATADPAFKGDIAIAYAHLADVQIDNGLNSLDKGADGEHNAARAVALFEQAEVGPSAYFHLWWARSLAALALAARSRGEVDTGLAYLERSRDICRQGLERHPGDPELRGELGSKLFKIGQFNDSMRVASMGRQEAAKAAFDEAEAVYRALYEEALSRPDKFNAEDRSVYPFQLGTIEGARALLANKYGKLPEAAQLHAAAVRWKGIALEGQPRSVAYRSGLQIEAANQAVLCMEMGDSDCALRSAKLGWETSRALQHDSPRQPSWTVISSRHMGRALLEGGMTAQALEVLREAEADLMAIKPEKSTPWDVEQLAKVRSWMAAAQARLGHVDLARRPADQAEQKLAELRQRQPEKRDLWLASAQLAAVRATFPGADGAMLRAQALAFLDRAAALQALWPEGPDARLRDRLQPDGASASAPASGRGRH